MAGHPVLTALYEGTCVRDTHGHGRNSIQALLGFSPHLLLDGTWHSQSLELFSQVASVTNIIFSKMAAARSRLRNVHFN